MPDIVAVALGPGVGVPVAVAEAVEVAVGADGCSTVISSVVASLCPTGGRVSPPTAYILPFALAATARLCRAVGMLVAVDQELAGGSYASTVWHTPMPEQYPPMA